MDKTGTYEFEVKIERMARDTLWGQYWFKVELYQYKPATYDKSKLMLRYVTSESNFAYTQRGAVKKALKQVRKLHKKYKTNKFGIVFETKGNFYAVEERLSEQK